MEVKNAVYGYELLYWCKWMEMINYNPSFCPFSEKRVENIPWFFL